MNNTIELSDEEKEYLSDYNRYNNKITMSEIYDFINKLLNDRFNKGKEERVSEEILKNIILEDNATADEYNYQRTNLYKLLKKYLTPNQ